MNTVVAEILLLTLASSCAIVWIATWNETNAIHAHAWDDAKTACRGIDNVPACYHDTPRVVNGRACRMPVIHRIPDVNAAVCDIILTAEELKENAQNANA